MSPSPLRDIKQVLKTNKTNFTIDLQTNKAEDRVKREKRTDVQGGEASDLTTNKVRSLKRIQLSDGKASKITN